MKTAEEFIIEHHGQPRDDMEAEQIKEIAELMDKYAEARAGQVNAIVMGLEEMGGMEHFVILEDGFVGKNGKSEFVQMDLRPLDGDSEGVGLAIAFSTDFMQYEGDYLPICLDKAETKQLIDYLTEIYEAL